MGNLIKVYSTMVSSTVVIEETLNETRKILNPKSQHDGTSTQSEGLYSKKSKTSTRSNSTLPDLHSLFQRRHLDSHTK